jgi:hypothetical protein
MSAGEHRGAVNHSIVDEGRYDAQLPFIIRPAELVADATRTLAELLTDWPATFELICDPLERSRPRRRILAASTAILVARSFSSTLYFRSAAMLSILHRFESLRQTRGNSGPLHISTCRSYSSSEDRAGLRYAAGQAVFSRLRPSVWWIIWATASSRAQTIHQCDRQRLGLWRPCFPPVPDRSADPDVEVPVSGNGNGNELYFPYPFAGCSVELNMDGRLVTVEECESKIARVACAQLGEHTLHGCVVDPAHRGTKHGEGASDLTAGRRPHR